MNSLLKRKSESKGDILERAAKRAGSPQGDYSPRAPTDLYVHFRAYGSSCHVLATRRYTE